jgi:hypothetical protein
VSTGPKETAKSASRLFALRDSEQECPWSVWTEKLSRVTQARWQQARADAVCVWHDFIGTDIRGCDRERSVSVPRTLKGVAVGDFSDAVLCR